MKLEKIVRDKELILDLLNVGSEIIVEDEFNSDVDNKIKNMYLHFFNRVFGSEFIKTTDFESLNETNLNVVSELIYLKFKDEEFHSEYEFSKHDDIMSLECKYKNFKDSLDVLDDEKCDAEDTLQGIEDKKDTLFETWLSDGCDE